MGHAVASFGMLTLLIGAPVCAQDDAAAREAVLQAERLFVEQVRRAQPAPAGQPFGQMTGNALYAGRGVYQGKADAKPWQREEFGYDRSIWRRVLADRARQQSGLEEER